jgi:hypothetical protein
MHKEILIRVPVNVGWAMRSWICRLPILTPRWQPVTYAIVAGPLSIDRSGVEHGTGVGPWPAS